WGSIKKSDISLLLLPKGRLVGLSDDLQTPAFGDCATLRRYSVEVWLRGTKSCHMYFIAVLRQAIATTPRRSTAGVWHSLIKKFLMPHKRQHQLHCNQHYHN